MSVSASDVAYLYNICSILVQLLIAIMNEWIKIIYWIWFLIACKKYSIFLHAKPWILGGEKSIFTVVIH